MVALSFTTILIQVQAVFHGNARDLLPILIAALLAMTGMARSLGARPELARAVASPASSCARMGGGRGLAPDTRRPCCSTGAGRAACRASRISVLVRLGQAPIPRGANAGLLPLVLAHSLRQGQALP